MTLYLSGDFSATSPTGEHRGIIVMRVDRSAQAFAACRSFQRSRICRRRLVQRPVAQAIDERKNLRDRFVDLQWDLLFQIEARENLQKLLILTDRDIVKTRQLNDFIGQVTSPFGDELRRIVLFRLIAQRDGLPSRCLIHTFTLRSRMSAGMPSASAVNLSSRS